MRTFPTISNSITGNLGEVLEEWRVAKQDEPWVQVPDGPGLHSLGEVVRYVAQVALERPDDPEARRQKVYAAAKHGQQRRNEGWSEALLFQEYALLRRAVWRFIQRRHGATDETFQAIGQIDVALTLATVAALRGFYQDLFVERGDWSEVLERLVDDWPARR